MGLNIPQTYQASAEVDIVWAYDSDTALWRAYSSNQELSSSLVAHSYATIENIPAALGYWVKSSSTQTFTLDSVLEPVFVCTDETTVPNITGAPMGNVQINHPYSYTPQTEYGGVVSSYSIMNKPEWLDFNTTSGTLSATAPSTTGEYNGIEITATNCKGSDNIVYSILVTELYPPYFEMLYDTKVDQSLPYVDFSFSSDAYWASRVNQVILSSNGLDYILDASDYNFTAENMRLNIANGKSTILRAPAKEWSIRIKATDYVEDNVLHFVQVIANPNSCTLPTYSYTVESGSMLNDTYLIDGFSDDNVSFVSRSASYGGGWFSPVNIGNEHWYFDYNAPTGFVGEDNYIYWHNNACGAIDINVTQAIPGINLSILDNSDTDSDAIHATIGLELVNTTFTDDFLLNIQIVGSLSAGGGWIYDDATHAHIVIGTEHMNGNDANLYVNVLASEITSDTDLTTNTITVKAP